ncbi:hypothetical protein [Paenibacillus sp. 32352]|uniref:hypothetical protein n=1 Tax=Paenibacillus sp. 32352 TaxID=1969111 RepID=UPI0009AC2267|nr:hypothetical protein [Paenibacillus sp. 32352]
MIANLVLFTMHSTLTLSGMAVSGTVDNDKPTYSSFPLANHCHQVLNAIGEAMVLLSLLGTMCVEMINLGTLLLSVTNYKNELFYYWIAVKKLLRFFWCPKN